MPTNGSTEMSFEALRAERDEARRQLADALDELDRVRSQLIDALAGGAASRDPGSSRLQAPGGSAHSRGRLAAQSAHERWCVPSSICCCELDGRNV